MKNTKIFLIKDVHFFPGKTEYVVYQGESRIGILSVNELTGAVLLEGEPAPKFFRDLIRDHRAALHVQGDY